MSSVHAARHGMDETEEVELSAGQEEPLGEKSVAQQTAAHLPQATSSDDGGNDDGGVGTLDAVELDEAESQEGYISHTFPNGDHYHGQMRSTFV